MDFEPNIRNKVCRETYSGISDQMPRSYRYIVFATVGGLAVLAIGAGAERAAIWTDSPSAFPEYRETAEDAQKRLPTLSMPQALKAAKDQQPCRQPQGRDASDLCAQWRATNAAERASRWAWWQLVLSFFGMVGLGVTLWFNLEAWRQARESEVDTDRAIAAAQKSADAAAQQAALFHEAQRAWVRLDLAPHKISRGHPDGLRFNVDVIAENVGQTVATHFELNAAILFKGPEESIEKTYERIERQVDAWESEHTAEAVAALMPKDRNLEVIREDISDKRIAWFTGFGHGVGRAQALILGAVYYRTESRPDLLQVSWRAWYISDNRGTKALTFIDRNTADLLSDEIRVTPYSQSTLHQERAPHPTANDTGRGET